MFPDFLIIDFDSTFISKESLDELAYYALLKNQADISVIKEIQKITDDFTKKIEEIALTKKNEILTV